MMNVLIMGRSVRMRVWWICVVLLLLVVVGYENKDKAYSSSSSSSSSSSEVAKEKEESEESWSWSLDRMKKMLWRQASAYFFPPNIDFRRSGSSASVSVVGNEDGKDNDDNNKMSGSGSEKVKEAVARSVEKGKTTVEESAKAAAHTAHDLLKSTFSLHHPRPPEL